MPTKRFGNELDALSYDAHAGVYTLHLNYYDHLDCKDIERLELIMSSQPMVAIAGLGERTAIYAQCHQAGFVDPYDHQKMVDALSRALAEIDQAES